MTTSKRPRKRVTKPGRKGISAEITAAVAAALDKPLKEVFKSFGAPVAAASIAQVHRASIATAYGERAVAVKVLRPQVERRFKGPGASGGGGAAQRFVTGISSGGWSSLWLQITYPDKFAGCW